ncbi:hypothetical protein RF11_16423 [Thelohanellus kitauei]|uniref:Uncharacterized protein n=1 Tax=Thelohanellus kitauei TaxID=669202 RepID=A0A0C2N1B0_THEKT|nr:hypothetical protein RF11_16423 [Thelohanellus kitauei]
MTTCCRFVHFERSKRRQVDHKSMMITNEENEDMLPVHIINYEEFSTIDKNLPRYDIYEDCADLIVEDDDDESPVPVTNQEAKKCIAVLQPYFTRKEMKGVLHLH